MCIPLDRTVFRRDPTLSDVEASSLAIEHHTAEITSLQNRISSLLLEVQALRKAQKDHHDQINVYKGVTTLARRIPPELLGKIFEHCVEDGWFRAPLIVSQVCSAWRAGARAPRVWSRIFVNCNASSFVSRTQFWLSKAAEAPLHITFTASLRGTAPGDLSAVTKLLLARAAHWETLIFDSIPPRDLHVIFSLCARNSFKHLRVITVRTELTFVDDIDGPGSDDFNLGEVFQEDDTPMLSTMNYSCNALPYSAIFPSHLQHLALETTESADRRPLSAEGYTNVLSNLLRLKGLTISMPVHPPRESGPLSNPSELISLPDLTTLTLYGFNDLYGILEYLDVPSLRALHIRLLEDHFYAINALDSSILALLTNCSPPLDMLELHDTDIRLETFARMFAQLVTLRELRLHDSHIDDETLDILRGPDGLCPRLSRLDLRWCQNFRGETLVKLVQSRIAVDGIVMASKPIEEITVINCSLVKEPDIISLAKTTVCRVVMRGSEDYCRTYHISFQLLICFSCADLLVRGSRECCGNTKYTQRLRFRHTENLSSEERSQLRLIM